MTSTTFPQITVIIAVYNGAKTLQQCLDSVAQQSYPHVELIVIDGGSQDGTVELIKANQANISYWVSEPDRGIYNAWNKALAQATGEWVCFLGADDFFWDAQVLERMAAALRRLPQTTRVAYGEIVLLGADDAPFCTVGEPWEKIKKLFCYEMVIPHPGTMHHRSLFEQHGVFDESFRIAGDYEFLLRELGRGDATFVPGLVVGMRMGGVSSDPKNSLRQLKEIWRIHQINGQKIPNRRLILGFVRLYLRRILWSVLGERLARQLLDLWRVLLRKPRYWTKV